MPDHDRWGFAKVERLAGIIAAERVALRSSRPDELARFEHSRHEGYSDLKPEELAFARALDETGNAWCRNPSQSGYGIPLIAPGRTRTFYPDFFAWPTDDSGDSYAIDTTGALRPGEVRCLS